VKLKRPIQSDQSETISVVGKITEFDQNNKKSFHYQVYMSPTELPGGK